jgi:hypothetical protein
VTAQSRLGHNNSRVSEVYEVYDESKEHTRFVKRLDTSSKYLRDKTEVFNSELSQLTDYTKRGEELVPLGRKNGTQNSNRYNKESSGYKLQKVPKRNLVSDYDIDSLPSQIPTLVNGEVCFSKKDVYGRSKSDRVSCIQSTLSESTRKILIEKRELSDSSKHKVLLLGDSHVRGYAAYMKMFLSTQFEISGYIKPGAPSKRIIETAGNTIDKFTMDDFVFLCIGSNDINVNDTRKVFQDVTKFVKSVNQTNIILISIPYRHDIVNPLIKNEINNEIKILNRKLHKLAKAFLHVNVIDVDSNRELFTTHGLHLNNLGKEMLSNRLLCHIYSALKETTATLIALEWQDSKLQAKPFHATRDPTSLVLVDVQEVMAKEIIVDGSANVLCLDKENCSENNNLNVGNPTRMKVRTSNRIKKACETKKDFLWGKPPLGSNLS